MTSRRRARHFPGASVLALCVTTLVLAACSHELPVAGSTGNTAAAATASPAGPKSSPKPAPGSRPGGVPDVEEGEVVADRLNVPWGVGFLPDGTALVGQRNGQVYRVGAGATTKVGTVPGVAATGEGGLLGMAIEAAAGNAATVYAYLTASGGNRVVKMAYADGRLGPPAVLLKGIAAATNHDGGALIIGPDNNLWVGTGDANTPSRAQDRASLNGKILRITKAGKVPADNPFKGSPVWSYGHRNVQGLAFDSRNRLWATEFGQNTWDELNRIVMGRNYGWPVVEGKKRRAGYVDPAAQWKTSDSSPSGMAIIDDVAYIGALRGERLWEVPLAETSAGTPVAVFKGDYGRIRNVVKTPENQLWITTSNRDGRGDPVAEDDRVISLTIRQ